MLFIGIYWIMKAEIGRWNMSHEENRFVVRCSLSLDVSTILSFLIKISSACLFVFIFACAKNM